MDTETTPCCTPSRGEPAGEVQVSMSAGSAQIIQKTVPIPEGTALLGTNSPLIPADGEGPLRQKQLSSFKITDTTITNDTFARFVADTGYVTEAERFGWSFVFFSDVANASTETQGVIGTEWWRRVDGAYWQYIHGPDAAPAQADHPVVQVSWTDAMAFANWCGGRLPTEAEWEHAARGGLNDVRFPWGDEEPNDSNTFPCNIWQGQFPNCNTGADGWQNTAPARSFAPNGYGLYNMVGNVWEWTAEPFPLKSLDESVARNMESISGVKVLKGGSYLCHRSYCYRYRIAARISNSPDSATPHQGFRVVWDAS